MIFLSDDKKARAIAKQHEVEVSGTLGVLIKCVDKNILSLSDANDLLKKMLHKGYRSPLSDLRELITNTPMP